MQINITGRASATALLCLAALALFSCSNGLLKDPRLYNSKQPSGMYVAPEPELGLTGGVDTFDDTEQWYNKRNSNGDGTKPGEVGFDASEFDTIQITGWFSSQNVPTYTMTKNAVWSPGDAPKGEYVHKSAPNTEGQGWKISGVTYYQYRGINPSYAPTGSYNTTLQKTSEGNPKLSRFYFYRFTGYGGGVQWLDNNLIAVDTYSKLVFAFSEPVQFSSMGAPTKWDPTDNEAFIGTTYQFYMYDPVGYVEKKDGKYNVVLYQWFKDNLAKGVYQPTLGGVDRNSQGTQLDKVATKKPDGAGKSPFNNHTKNFFEENMKIFSEKPFQYREKMDNGGYGLKLYTFKISADGKKLTKTTSVWRNLGVAPEAVVYTIGAGDTATKGAISGGDGKLGWLEVQDGNTLVLGKDETTIETASLTFKDPGPQFLERVKHNPTYTGESTYEFKAGSPNTLVIDGETYKYVGSPSDTSRTIYEYNGWYYGVELTNTDRTVESTPRSGYYAIQWHFLGWTANLVEEAKASFIDNVKGKWFSLREKDGEGLWGLDLLTYHFDENGKATFTRKHWENGVTETKTHAVADGGNGTTGTVGGQSATIDTSAGTLTIDGKEYTQHYTENDFNDPGPSFIYRVKGKTYVEAGKTKDTGYSYTFSFDGKTCVYKNPNAGWLQTPEATYEYEPDNDKGVSGEYIYAVYGGYFVDLTKGKDGKPDSVFRMENTKAASDYWAADMEWEAILQE